MSEEPGRERRVPFRGSRGAPSAHLLCEGEGVPLRVQSQSARTSPPPAQLQLVPRLQHSQQSHHQLVLTSRDRPKSAPYPRLKNSKRTSKCQFTVLENRKSKKMDGMARRGPLARAAGALKGEHLQNCQHFCRSWRGGLWRKNKFSKKSLTMPKNWKGDPFGFLNTQSVVKYQRTWK